MNRVLFGTLILGFWSLPSLPAADKSKPPTAITELLRMTPEEFIKRFDKNRDGVLTWEEVPGIQSGAFAKLDLNGDGKLDAKEIDRMLHALRSLDPKELEKKLQALHEHSPASKDGKRNLPTDAEIARLLQLLEKKKDGRVSRLEVQGRLRDHFATLDANRDGYLDRKELQAASVRPVVAQPQPLPIVPAVTPSLSKEPPDFDTLDLNADGRITRDELQGTPYHTVFDAIDANKDGKISPKEFDAYFKKQGAGKDDLTGKK